MKQTTLAFLAVLMITLYSANQQRSLIHAQNGRYAREIEMAATDLALAKLAEIGRLAFDEGDVDDGIRPEDPTVRKLRRRRRPHRRRRLRPRR